jgi:rod shape determining protein RodA
MCFAADIPLRFIMMTFLTGALTIIFTVLPLWQSEILKKNVALVSLLTQDKLRFILIFAVGMITIIGILGKIFFKNKYYYWIAYFAGIFDLSLLGAVGAGKVLKDYQIKRLIVFLDPSTDPLGSGWNIIQSKIAIGSGSLLGQGFLNGTQSHYRFLPQQSTDFIFSILSEEWGFAGGAFVFFLFLMILLRTLYIIRNTTNIYGYYIAVGILTMIFFHFVVNIGMVMGIMPITGIPLLFLSYGGSSLWTAMTCIGLLMSINYRRLDF